MADFDDEAAAASRAKRSFRKFTYRGVDLDALLDLDTAQLVELVNARARRRFQRGLKRKPMGLIKKLRKVSETNYRLKLKLRQTKSLMPSKLIFGT
jgi:small subunit ribosomal protein S15e